ncbi:MAG TPA: 6-bladed beta-propeller, partial [Bacteroidia bacterium]|nr:6-bladed beta-propeller [Bacteroidia bacterium]
MPCISTLVLTFLCVLFVMQPVRAQRKKKNAAEVKKAVLVYPSPPEQPRYQYLTKITSSNDIGKKQSAFSRLVIGDQKMRTIVKPYGLSIHGGKIVVCDNYGGGMEVLDLDKHRFDFLITQGKGRLKIPINNFVDEKGWLYVADVGRSEIVIFDEKGNYVRSFGNTGKFKPSDVCVYDHKIFVANSANSRINVFSNDSSCKLLYSIPKEDSLAPVAICMPTNITIANNKLYVADFGCAQVKIFTPEGTFLDTLGSLGDHQGQFSKLKGIAVDKEENIYTVDAAFDHVQVFNKEKRLLI